MEIGRLPRAVDSKYEARTELDQALDETIHATLFGAGQHDSHSSKSNLIDIETPHKARQVVNELSMRLHDDAISGSERRAPKSRPSAAEFFESVEAT